MLPSGDVEIVGELHVGIVDDGEQAAVGLGGQTAHSSVHLHLIETHAGDADVDPPFAIERHAERRAADVSEHFVAGVVGREPLQDVAVTVARVENVVAVKNDVLGAFEYAEADDADVAQVVLRRERRTGAGFR